MSPSAVNTNINSDQFASDLNLTILGLGVEYPPFSLGPEALETLANRFYKKSIA
jgi:type III polyketide synthase